MEKETDWTERRIQLIEELTPVFRERYPLLSWKAHADLVTAAVDAKILYERFGSEP